MAGIRNGARVRVLSPVDGPVPSFLPMGILQMGACRIAFRHKGIATAIRRVATVTAIAYAFTMAAAADPAGILSRSRPSLQVVRGGRTDEDGRRDQYPAPGYTNLRTDPHRRSTALLNYG